MFQFFFMHVCTVCGQTAQKEKGTYLRGSHPVTKSGDDGVKVLDFPFQQNHSGLLLADRSGMVQHHVENVTQFVGDACILET